MDGVLTFVQSNNGKTLTMTDGTTWSDPALTDITAVVITITFDDVTYTVVNETAADWAGATPIQSELEWEVTADEVGQTADTAFLDGVYTVLYTVTVGSGTFTPPTYNVLLDYNVRYCVYDTLRQLPDIHACVDLCTNKQVERANFMYTYLKALEYSAACGQVNEIETILASLQNLCLNPGINECYCN